MSRQQDDDDFDLDENSVDDLEGYSDGLSRADDDDADDDGAPGQRAAELVLLHDAAHVWHPYTQHHHAPLPVPIVRAKGAWLYDTDGRAILDAISSWWVTTHGHCHDDIIDAITDQAKRLDQVIFAGFTHEPAAALAAELVQRLPRGLSKIFFSDDGSTAVEVAIKLSLQSFSNRGTPRRLIAALDNAYHGDTFGAMAASGRGVFTQMYEPLLFEVARLPDPSVGDTIAALDALIAARGSELAAVIVEPLVLGASGMRVWDEQVLRDIRDRTTAAGVHLIADEVLTGFGRTGPLFACERAEVRPDLLCMSKGLTGGVLPLGATAATEDIFDAFRSEDRRKTFFHGHSYTANPIACAAALASLQLFDDDCEDDRIRIEVAHARHLEALRGTPGVRAVRQIGTIAAVELEAPAGYLSDIGRELAAFSLQEGVLLRPLGNVAYCLPPYCITDIELDRVYDVISRFLGGARAVAIPTGGPVDD
ncbi:MAG: adenosylmethionine--8-amino-7-oxononanoate transaminase [Gemmatimonadota bacterium]|nr:adenosylmethionine--8-amino-7-oxononanoate transaminase [Gemmatimonadota bacterium]MDQ8167553.1 adenosylmethionine--8-amino-7-oxononanoate transaminase [Gemmatimonadota bacterium]